MTNTKFQVGDLVEIAEFNRVQCEMQVSVVTGYRKYYWGTAMCIVTTDDKTYTKDPFSLRKL